MNLSISCLKTQRLIDNNINYSRKMICWSSKSVCDGYKLALHVCQCLKNWVALLLNIVDN